MNEDFKPRNRKGRILPREVANVSLNVKILKKKKKNKSTAVFTTYSAADELLRTITILYWLDSECIVYQITRHFTVHNM